MEQGASFGESVAAFSRTVLQTGEKRERPVRDARDMMFVDWAAAGGFIADREPVDFAVWRYLKQVYESIPRELASRDPKVLEQVRGFDFTVMKGGQSGGSIIFLLLAIYVALLDRYRVGYFMPTKEHALDFSTNRFIRFVRDNPAIHALMGDPMTPHNRQIVDEGAAGMRRILSSIVYFLYLYGSVTTESKPLDALIFDEVQEMTPADVEKACVRIDASPLKFVGKVSTANFEGDDIDYFYQRSDQREMHTRCRCTDGIVLARAWHGKDGPSCIGEGNGTTPGIPKGYFYRCSRCDKVIEDPQDGVFRSHNPTSPRIGHQWPQMLSPRISCREIMQKWVERVDTKNFFNRVLGLPFTDPNTQPITDDVLAAAETKGKAQGLRWGKPRAGQYPRGVFMGIDQMGGDNRIVVAAQTDHRIRYLHLEVVLDDDPFQRCAEVMDEYRVRHCVVENLPNYNDAFRFAKRFNRGGVERVFIAQYQDLENEMLSWWDRPRDNIKVRNTEEEVKTRFSVTLDQYKCMDWALARWTHGEVEMPDMRLLTQTLVTKKGRESVALGKEFGRHLKAVALVTELRGGEKSKERKLRRAVKKVGFDPHFAYANMLMCVAMMRAYGADRMFHPDLNPGEGAGMPQPSNATKGDSPKQEARPMIEEPKGVQLLVIDGSEPPTPPKPRAKKLGAVAMDQVRGAMPQLFNDPKPAEGEPPRCGNCVNFDKVNRCTYYQFKTVAEAPSCEGYLPEMNSDRGFD